MDAESGGSALSSPSGPTTMSEGASPQERKIQDIKGRLDCLYSKGTLNIGVVCKT